MKKSTMRILVLLTLALVMVMAVAVPAFATTDATADGLEEAVKPVVELLSKFLKPLIAVIGAAGTLYCVVLGVKFARAEEPQDREKAKAHLKSAIIGFVLIFVLMVVLNGLIDPLLEWAESQM